MGKTRQVGGDPAAHFRFWQRHEMQRYLEFLMHSYRVMDAFWFLNIEKEQGLEQACRFNERVWAKVGSLATRDIKKRFGIEGGGLKALVRVLEYYPWTILTGYGIEERADEVLLSVPSCPSQEGRLRHGLGEYPCKAMHEGEFRAIAVEVDPKIRVECLFAPPDAHPPDTYCRWRFSMVEEAENA